MIRKNNQKGFTLIELMIASSLFAVILLVVSIGLLQIGRVYFKGITSAYTHEVTRNVIEDISEAIQLSGEDVTNPIANNGAVQGFCVGPRRYSYQRGQLKDTGPGVRHALVVDVLDECNGTGPGVTSPTQAQNINGTLTTNSRELVGENMRIANLVLTNLGGGFYQITVRIVYGDNDLLCSPALNDCNTNGVTDVNRTDLQCKPSERGGQFCSAAELTTTIQRRIQ